MNDLALKTLEPRELRLNTISLRGFYGKKLRKGSGGGSGDGFPQLPGDVTRWHFGGLTNEMMAAMDDPRIEDADGKGRFLSFKNFAWKGMSGVGGYVTNKDIYEYDLDRYSYTFIENGAKVHDFYIVFELIGYDENFKDGFNLDVRSISQGLKYRKTYTKNGIYIFQYKDEEGLDDLFAIGYNGNGGARSNFTVKVLPLYPGALVFDGVDDCGVCDNFPILTKEKGYTVVALRKWLTPETKTINEVLLGNFKNNPIWTSANFGAFQFEVKYNVSKKVQTDSFGMGNNITLNNNHLFSYQISNSYNGSILRLGSNVGGNFFTVGCGGDQFYANATIWELVFLDHDATEEELTKIKDYFVKTYPWLFPDQAWTVTGKTNEDEDRATIANITGNGNDLVLSNFGFAEGSGYGLYAYNFNDTSWIRIPDYGVISDKTSKSFNIKSFVLADYPVLYTAVNKDSSIKKVKIKVTNSIPGFYFGNKPANQIIDLSTDGIYEIPSYNSPNDVTQYGFRCSNVNDSCNITIEQIPEYEGYLVTDGVDDIVNSSNFTLGKDFTIIGEWKFMNNIIANAGISKALSLFVYNTDNGLRVFINNTTKGPVLNTKTLKAICSDGRVYSDDWSEMIINEEQPITSSKSSLLIGINGNNFAKIALKNLAIYNQILSKDDCIKAYNYLQTLKAK